MVAASLLASPVAQATIEITKFDPTPLFPRAGEPAQLAYLTVLNTGEQPVPLRARIVMQGQPEQRVELGSVSRGASTHNLSIPDITAPTQLRIELLDGGGAKLAEWEGVHQPQRKWVVYIVKSSHEDLGYEEYIFAKQREIANNIDLAKHRSGDPDPPAGAATSGPAKYHYMMESLIFQQNYTEERSESAWRELVEKEVKTGSMYLIGVPNGAHNHWQDYEELARFMYPGRRDLKDRFGLDSKTYLIVDNPSISNSAAQAAIDAGFKYLCRFGQPWRTGGNNDYATTKVPALFWWKTPDGSRALYTWRSHYAIPLWYGQSGGGDSPGKLMELGAINVVNELRDIESGKAMGPYPYDALIVPCYSDHETPWFDTRALNLWRRAYSYPEIRIGGPDEFFEHIEKNWADQLPELSGDLNNFSGDYAAIDPASQDWKRKAARLLPIAESKAALASALDIGFLPPSNKIERTFGRMFDYAEHSWPTSPRASDHHVFNSQWVKHNEADRALVATNEILAESSHALLRHIPTSSEQRIVVFNPLIHPRTDLVEASVQAGGIVDLETNQPVVIQKGADGKISFVATDVPALGYKVYRIATGDAARPASGLIAEGVKLENEFYAITFDRATGTVTSIVDKELKRELIDPAAPHKFNQLLRYSTKDRTSPESKTLAAGNAKSLTPSVGPLSAEMMTKIDDPQTGGQITQTVRLFAGVKRIDVLNELHDASVMYSSQHQERYRENLMYAFPIQIDGFEARAEYPGGVVRPHTDQLRWGSHDYLTPNRWVDVSNKDFGVTMVPWNAPTVMFGEIRYNKFSIDYKPEKSYLYSYAWSNRMAGLLTLTPHDCDASFGYSFTSHAGDWDSGATTQFGWSVASPLQATVLPAGQSGTLPAGKASFASVDKANVQLTTVKPSAQPGRGWVVRLVETEGKPGLVTLELPTLPFDRAVETNLVEDDKHALKVDGRKVTVEMKPFAMKTIRVFADESAPVAVQSLSASTRSDSQIELRWSHADAGKGLAYNIYRSDDPGAPATAYTLIGRATDTSFVDTGRTINTRYYYYVAPVTAKNTQGAVSEQVSALTDAKNSTPPEPVTELGIVRQAPDRLTIYWRKTRESDIGRYLVFRSETPDFNLAGATPIGEALPSRDFLQLYRDSGLKAGTTYYYKVIAEDFGGLRQTQSPLATATTPKE